MRKGITRITLGITLLVLQFLSLIGNAATNIAPNKLAFYIGYFLPGICGALLLFLGIRAYLSGETAQIILHNNQTKAHTVTKFVFLSLLILVLLYEGYYFISYSFDTFNLIYIIVTILFIVYFVFYQDKKPSLLFASSTALFGALHIYGLCSVILNAIIYLDINVLSSVMMWWIIRLAMGVVYILIGVMLYKESFNVLFIKVLGGASFILAILVIIVSQIGVSTIYLDLIFLPLTIFVYTSIIQISDM